jgi:hypothetical protein
MSVRLCYLIAFAAVLGCASGGVSPPRSPVRNSTLLTSAQMVEANADEGTAYDAVSRLRPNWLVGHGVATQGSEYAVVFIDGQQVGGPEALRNIHAFHVAEIRYYDITQAGARFGLRAGTGGVIEVRQKTP